MVGIERKSRVFAISLGTCRRGIRRRVAAPADHNVVCRVSRHTVRLAVEHAAAAAAAAELVAARSAAANDDDLDVGYIVGRRKGVCPCTIQMDKPVADSHQLAVLGRLVDVAVGAERAHALECLPGLAAHHVHRADAEVVRHVLLETEHGNRELRACGRVVEQSRPVVSPGLLLAVRPHLVLDAASVRAGTAERHGAGELHVCIAHVDDCLGKPCARLPNDDRDERLYAPAHLRALCHERRVDLEHRVVLGLDPVGRTHPLRIAALVYPAVERACTNLLSANHEIVVRCRVVVRNRMLERDGRLKVAVEICAESLVAEHERPVRPLDMAVAAYVEQLVLVLDRAPAVCAKLG